MSRVEVNQMGVLHARSLVASGSLSICLLTPTHGMAGLRHNQFIRLETCPARGSPKSMIRFTARSCGDFTIGWAPLHARPAVQ